MSLGTWLKSRITDRALAPVRRAIVDLVPEDARVLELGFGTGDLLFRLSGRIREGIGLELDGEMIAHARARAAAERSANLRFERFDVTQGWPELGSFDVATATLVVHELPEEARVGVLGRMGAAARWVIVADYDPAPSRLAAIFTHFDELLAGHRDRYVGYLRAGGMPALARAAGLRIEVETGVLRGGLRVWKGTRGG